jgi:hypothetical protein
MEGMVIGAAVETSFAAAFIVQKAVLQAILRTVFFEERSHHS